MIDGAYTNEALCMARFRLSDPLTVQLTRTALFSHDDLSLLRLGKVRDPWTREVLACMDGVPDRSDRGKARKHHTGVVH